VPVTEVAQILADDYKRYIPLLTTATATATAITTAAGNKEEGIIFIKRTVDIYITIIIKL
jgi:hypothetical protein